MIYQKDMAYGQNLISSQNIIQSETTDVKVDLFKILVLIILPSCHSLNEGQDNNWMMPS